MANAKVSETIMREAWEAVKQCGDISKAAKALHKPRATIQSRYYQALSELDLPDTRSLKDGRISSSKSHSALSDRVSDTMRSGRLKLDDIAASVGASAGECIDVIEALKQAGKKVKQEPGGIFYIESETPQAAWIKGQSAEIISRPDNTFVFGAMGDLHAGSKYCRWDSREDLIRRAEMRGAQAVFDTGNYIDGHAPFNRYDLEAVGMAQQTKMLAERHPKTALPIYAVTGDDHEGWYSQREGVDIGWYTEKTMREAGHNWTDLGYMEAHVKLTNANTGKSHVLAVVHPGGGSAYALSYRPQKIIESLEGGEKPAVLLMGHYHKLEAGNTRNVWYVQTGCCQDQTPFMRKKSIEAHVGGAIVTLEQDPRTGAIVGMTPELIRYFNRSYHDLSRRWSHHGSVALPPRER